MCEKIEFEGSLVILGDVNSGAEVIAGENIVILGDLRGLAHAGARGNKKAVIIAVDVCFLVVSFCERIKDEIVKATGIERDAIFINYDSKTNK